MPIIPIRPSKLFGLVDLEGAERVMKIRMPRRREDRPDRAATMLLDTMVLLAAMKLIKAKRVFEIGTCLGATTVNLALNVEPGGEVFTLDLDRESATGLAQPSMGDADATDFHFSHPMEWTRPGLEVLPITQLHGNSTRFDFSPYHDLINLVWIDGGHDFETIYYDTDSAWAMVDDDSPWCIAWHDYANIRQCPDVTRFLLDHAGSNTLYWVEDTMTVLQFSGGQLG